MVISQRTRKWFAFFLAVYCVTVMILLEKLSGAAWTAVFTLGVVLVFAFGLAALYFHRKGL